MNRRVVLKTLISSLAALPKLAHGATSNVTQNDGELFPRNVPGQEWAQFSAAGYDSPACGVVYRRKYRPVNGLPLGGIDTGRLDVGADSRSGFFYLLQLVFSRARVLEYAVSRPHGGRKGKWVLTDTHDTYGGYMFAGVRTASEIHYWGHFPVADLEYELPGSPVQVGVRAWSPFLPGDSKSSNTPARCLKSTCAISRIPCSVEPWPSVSPAPRKPRLRSPCIPRGRRSGLRAVIPG